MAYAQWVEITIVGVPGETLHVRNAQHGWGKFYAAPNKDAELGVDAVNRLTVGPGPTPLVLGACGRSSAASGTQGSFDLYDDAGRQAAHCEWDCPWGRDPNRFVWNHGPGWSARVSGERVHASAGYDETYSTPDNPVVRDAPKGPPGSPLHGSNIYELGKYLVKGARALFSSPTPGALGAIRVELGK